MLKIIVLTVSIASASGVTQNPERLVTMQDLTVPEERLPAGCGVSPATSVVQGNRVRGDLWAGLQIPTNPWTGTDRNLMASIRERMYGQPLVPDAPLTKKDASGYSLKLAEGLEEAYAAIYNQSEPALIVVYALRPAVIENPFAFDHPSNKSGSNGSRFEIGSVAIFISGDSGPCFQAIEAHLKSLGK